MVIRLLEQSPSHAVRVTAPFTQGGLWCGATGENHPLQIPSQSAFILVQGRENSWRIDYLYPPAALVVADYAQLTAISCGYAFSHAPSLLLSAKKRRLRFGFFAGAFTGEAESAVGNTASKPKELQLYCEWAASFSRKGKSTLKGRWAGLDKSIKSSPLRLRRRTDCHAILRNGSQ